jgi:hypothetical protein
VNHRRGPDVLDDPAAKHDKRDFAEVLAAGGLFI